MNRINDSELLNEYLQNINFREIISGNLINKIEIHTFKIHEALFNEEDEIEYLYILLEGQVGVTPYSEMGKYSILDIVLPGDIIGDIEYLNGDRYYYQVLALTPCVLMALPVAYVEKYFLENVEFYKYMSRNLAKKMKRTSHKYSRTMLYPLKNRLAQYLYELYEINGNIINGVNTVQVADYFGISSRHLRRVLLEIESEGIIKRNKKTVEVIDEKKLKVLASYL